MNVIQRYLRWGSMLSLRSKLIIGNIAIATLAMVAIGFLTVSRTANTSAYLTGRLNESERLRAEGELTDSTIRYARDLNEFFTSVENSMEILGLSTQAIFEQEETLGESSAWDARTQLTQLPTGSWDNANIEPGSIFLPRGSNITVIYRELNALKQLDTLAPRIQKSNPNLIAVYFGSQKGATYYYPNIDLAALLPADFDVEQRPWYIAASPKQNPGRDVVWSEPYLDAANNGVVVTSSLPIIDEHSVFRGVIAIDLKLADITTLISTIRYGESGYAFLIDRDGHMIAVSEAGYQDFGITAEEVASGSSLEKNLLLQVPLNVFNVLAKMTTAQSGVRIVEINGTEKYIAYHPIAATGYSLGLVVDVLETQKNVMEAERQLVTDSRRTILNLAGIMVAVWAVFLLVSRALGNALTLPLVELTKNAQRIADGNLDTNLKSTSDDEVGVLAKTLDAMTQNLRSVINQTEQRVIERTADLQEATLSAQRRAEELKTISEVGRTIATEIDLESLLNVITYMVSERFGFYHVGVFLIDNVSKDAVLRAANSPGGKRMLERRHKLHIGQEGIVGYVAGTGEARIVLDVGADAVYFNNPDMPSTRSEMALPLKLRGAIIGVLDVQSTKANAFTSEDVETLGILADQIAIAIENARLLAESQQALSEVQALYGEYIGRTWERKTAKAAIGYHHTSSGGRLLNQPADWEEAKDAIATGRTLISARPDENDPESIAAMAVPIRLYNQTIGVIDIRSPDPNHRWKEDEIAAVEAIADRLALALENARLFEETSARAAREHAVAEISTKIRSTNDPQAMIRTAIEELQRVLGVTRVEIIPQTVSSQPGDTADDQ